MRTIQSFLRADAGVTAVEYGLIVALIALVIIGALTIIGTNLSTLLTDIANKL